MDPWHGGSRRQSSRSACPSPLLTEEGMGHVLGVISSIFRGSERSLISTVAPIPTLGLLSTLSAPCTPDLGPGELSSAVELGPLNTGMG